MPHFQDENQKLVLHQLNDNAVVSHAQPIVRDSNQSTEAPPGIRAETLDMIQNPPRD